MIRSTNSTVIGTVRPSRTWGPGLVFAGMCLAVGLQSGAWGQDPGGNEAAPAAQEKEPQRPAPPVDKAWVRLHPKAEVWIDSKSKEVIVGGMVCLREGQLEMFACPRDTKEHESVVSVNSPAKYVHAGLLAVGAKPGKPVQFDPQYVPASGTIVDVFVQYLDSAGKLKRVRAQSWIQQLKTGKEMEQEWVFAGSGFFVDEQTGEKYYYADGGELVCVSNFPTAMLDLTIKSSQATGSLLFSAFKERIPPRKTPVQLVLKPRPPEKTETPNKTETSKPADK